VRHARFSSETSDQVDQNVPGFGLRAEQTDGTIRSENRAMMPPFTRLPGRDLAGPGLRAGQRADRRGRLALGLGFATTGALLNHGAQMTWEVPPNGRVLRSPRGPKDPM
jgi:hypothetical protein